MALSKREQVMLNVAIVGGILFGGGFLFVEPASRGMFENMGKSQKLETELKELVAKEDVLKSDKSAYELKSRIPDDVIVKTFQPNTKEQVLKQMLDDVLQTSAQSGNEFVSLEPGKDEATATPPAPPPKKDDSAATSSPLPDNLPKLEFFNYELGIRGTYSNVVSLLSAIAHQPETIEVMGIKVQNEAGPTRESKETAGAVSHINPLKPIKVAVKLKLFLMPNL
jgi:hypothetical protein